MKSYYISGTYHEGDFDESFQKIIQAKSKKEAKSKLSEYFDFDRIDIDQCYETSSDAMV